MKFEFNPDAKVTYGLYRCENCRIRFHGGGPRCCKCTGELTYLYTPQELEKLKQGKQPVLADDGLLEYYQKQNEQH